MSNNKDFKVKNGILPTSYQEGLGTVVSGSEGYYLAGASYDSVSFDISSQASYIFDFGFADSGTKMYAQRSFDGGTIYQYTLSTAYDISTASYASKSFSFADGESGFVITPNGSHLYISANDGDAVYRYTFGTAFDVSTLSSGTQMFSTSSVDTQPDKCRFNDDGSKFFLLGRANNRIYEYTVSTAYDLSTATYSNNSLLVSSQAAAPLGFDFSSDGTKLIVSDNTTDSVYLYNLSTGFDITTASYSNTNFSLSSQDSVPSGVSFNTSGSKMFILGNVNNTIFQYSTALNTNTLDLSTGSVFDLTPTSDAQVTLSNPAASGTVSQATLLLGSEDSTGVGSTFSTTLYDGTGAAQTITNGIDLAGDGGMVWLKNRDGAFDHHIYDTVRGVTKKIIPNKTNSESADSSGITAFNSNGFSIGAHAAVNTSGNSIASWTFKKQTKFFDIVTYTGTGSAQNISHDLGSDVGFLLIKRTDSTGNWRCWHRGLPGTGSNMEFNQTGAYETATTIFNGTDPTSTQFSVGTNSNVNASGGTYVAYLFAHDTAADGLIQCGSYTGTGADGNSVTLGWEPQFIIIKSATGSGNWIMFDSARGMTAGNDPYLMPNKSNAEGTTTDWLDATATGFDLKAENAVNASGETYIYMAIRNLYVPTITYDPTLEWPGGTAPTAPAEGETDVITFNTSDGGTTYSAVQAIDGAK